MRPKPGSNRVLLLVAAALLTLAAFGACGSKKSGPQLLGELVEILSGGASKRSPDATWSESKAGATFVAGDALRTELESEARLKFAGEILRMGPETTVYFGKKKFDFEGEIEVGKGVADMGIDFGEAEITTTGRVRLVKRNSRMRFEVLVGQATITERGTVSTLKKGQELVFEIGAGTVERITPRTIDAGVPIPAPLSDAGSDSADAGSESASGQVSATVAGSQVRSRSGDGEDWKRLAEGDHSLSADTQLELKGKSSVVLERGESRVTLSGPSRAVVGAEGEELVRLEKGRAAARSEAGAVVIAVPGGSIQLHAGDNKDGRAEIDVGRDGALTKVLAGRATLRMGDEVDDLSVGESAVLGKKRIEVIDRAPTVSHFTLLEAKDFTLHTTKTPANLRIDFRKHCQRATVEIAKGRSFRRPAQSRVGEGSAIVSLSSGSHRYRVRCFESDALAKGAVMQGKVNILKDSGTRPLPKTAPVNTIDADGRRWNVLFQNRLPSLRFRWPKAPKAKRYELKVVPVHGKTRTLVSTKPEKELKSGTFGEGIYEYWFVGNGKASKHSQLRIAFDNAAARGYLSSPKPGAKLTGSEVRVVGAAVSGWKVYVGGKELALDNQYRFDENVPLGADGVAVRFSHPRYGTHYYLRRR